MRKKIDRPTYSTVINTYIFPAHVEAVMELHPRSTDELKWDMTYFKIKDGEMVQVLGTLTLTVLNPNEVRVYLSHNRKSGAARIWKGNLESLLNQLHTWSTQIRTNPELVKLQTEYKAKLKAELEASLLQP